MTRLPRTPPPEEALAGRLRTLLQEAHRRLKRALASEDDDRAGVRITGALAVALRAWRAEAGAAITRARLRLALRGVRDAASEVGAVLKLDAHGNMEVAMRGRRTRIQLVERLRAQGNRTAIRAADQLETRIRTSYAGIIHQGGSLEEAEAEAVRVLGASEHRAEVIARDQLAKAAKEGRQAFIEPFADLYARRWRTNLDGRERASHHAMAGKLTLVNRPWIVDYSLDAPAATSRAYPSAVPEMIPGESEWGIQCRCDMEFVPLEDLSPDELALLGITRATPPKR